MKKVLLTLIIATIALMATACTRVPPGEVGVKVYLNGGSKGVSQEVLGTGRYWIGFNEDLYLFPIFQQNHNWTKSATESSPTDESITFQTSDGMSMGADIGITYNIPAENVGSVFQKYRKGVDELTNVVLRNMVRDAFVHYASSYTAEEAYSTKKAALLDSVKVRVMKSAGKDGIVVSDIYYIGSMTLPKQILDALNNKIKTIQDAQRIENEVRSAKAEAEKTVVIAEGKALAMEAEARGNRALAASITPTLIELKRIEKWNGQLPQVQGGSGTFVTLK